MTISDDNESRAREIAANWYENEQGIDNYIAPLVRSIAAALAAAETRGRIKGLKEAQKDYAEFHRWVAERISDAAYRSEELEQGLTPWEELADTMHNGMMASFENPISARLASLQPEVAKREEGE